MKEERQMATISAEKFAEKVSRAVDTSIDAKKRNGMLGSIVGDLKALIKTIEGLTTEELDDRLSALHFAEPLFAQLKPEVVEQVNAFREQAEALLNGNEATPVNDNIEVVMDTMVDTTTNEVDEMADAITQGEVAAANATPEEKAAAQVTAPTKTPKASTAGEKKKGKPVDPNSGRQQIIRVLRDNGLPMTPNEIKKQLESEGIDVKFISSHLNYFKSHGQCIHGADKKYSLPASAYAQQGSNSTETTVVVESVDSLESTSSTEANSEDTEETMEQTGTEA
jgi:arginine repressor